MAVTLTDLEQDVVHRLTRCLIAAGDIGRFAKSLTTDEQCCLHLLNEKTKVVQRRDPPVWRSLPVGEQTELFECIREELQDSHDFKEQAHEWLDSMDTLYEAACEAGLDADVLVYYHKRRGDLESVAYNLDRGEAELQAAVDRARLYGLVGDGELTADGLRFVRDHSDMGAEL